MAAKVNVECRFTTPVCGIGIKDFSCVCIVGSNAGIRWQVTGSDSANATVWPANPEVFTGATGVDISKVELGKIASEVYRWFVFGVDGNPRPTGRDASQLGFCPGDGCTQDFNVGASH